jgi:hypothetical protein
MRFLVLVIVLLLGSSIAIQKAEYRNRYFEFFGNTLDNQLVRSVTARVAESVKQRQEMAQDGGSLFGLEREWGWIWQNPLTCGVCHAGLSVFDFIIDNYYVRQTFEMAVALICTTKMDYEVCKGAVHEMAEIIIPQMVDFATSPSYGCSRLMGFCSSPKWKTLDSQDYIDRVLSDKPDFIKDNDYVNKEYEKINNDKKQRKTVKVLHITDLHLDFDYKEGMNANCGEPLC